MFLGIGQRFVRLKRTHIGLELAVDLALFQHLCPLAGGQDRQHVLVHVSIQRHGFCLFLGVGKLGVGAQGRKVFLELGLPGIRFRFLGGAEVQADGWRSLTGRR